MVNIVCLFLIVSFGACIRVVHLCIEGRGKSAYLLSRLSKSLQINLGSNHSVEDIFSALSISLSVPLQ